ncbi:hypothetical protein D0868_15002 [Hortaea werneckii]|uniref:CS domain-containing protein n=1 Tax=Hortaea werneckii TaxID=91943 RepID=A0A3M6X8W6_HORWE|nr:hypothetical protein D0868_15002 [Hortaea werneckii]
MEVPKNTTDTAFAGKVLTPEVTWAQRSSATEAEKNHIFLTIAVPDVDPKKIKLDVQPTHVDFSGYSETKKAQYAVKLDFYAEIDPAGTKIHHTQRDIEMVVQKKQLGEEYWPRLLKDKAKVHFLKTDFNKVCFFLELSRVVTPPFPRPLIHSHTHTHTHTHLFGFATYFSNTTPK